VGVKRSKAIIRSEITRGLGVSENLLIESIQEVVEGANTWDIVRVKATDCSKDSIVFKSFDPSSDAIGFEMNHSDEGAKYFRLILSRSTGIGVVRG